MNSSTRSVSHKQIFSQLEPYNYQKAELNPCLIHASLESYAYGQENADINSKEYVTDNKRKCILCFLINAVFIFAIFIAFLIGHWASSSFHEQKTNTSDSIVLLTPANVNLTHANLLISSAILSNISNNSEEINKNLLSLIKYQNISHKYIVHHPKFYNESPRVTKTIFDIYTPTFEDDLKENSQLTLPIHRFSMFDYYETNSNSLNNLKPRKPILPLANTVLLIHYDIQMDFSQFAIKEHINGNVSIYFKPFGNSTEDELVFHAASNIFIQRILLYKAYSGKLIGIKSVKRDLQQNLVRAFLNEPLERKKEYKLKIEFRTKICQSEFEGTYCFRSSLLLPKKSASLMARINGFVTKFEPRLARTFLPCWDEPHIKTTFNVSVLHSNQYTMVLSNTAIHSQQVLPSSNEQKDNNGNNNNSVFIITQYEPTPKMSIYLLAFAIGYYTPLELKTNNSMPLTIWVEAENVLALHYAANFSPIMFDKIEEDFGVKYPIQKLDFVAVPKLSVGGMENWGLVIFNINYLVLTTLSSQASSSFSSFPSIINNQLKNLKIKKNNNSTAINQIRKSMSVDRIAKEYKIEKIITHEIIHQWFGNLVTMYDWNNLWLKEGFTTYFVFDFLSEAHPYLTEYEYYQNLVQLFEKQSSTSPQALTRENNLDFLHNDNQDNLFDGSNLYTKGAVIVKMIKDLIGTVDFHAAITRYLKQYAFKSVDKQSLWNCLPTYADHGAEQKRLSNIFDSWLYNEGIPEVFVARNYDDQSIRIKQEIANQNRYSIFLQYNDKDQIKNVITRQRRATSKFQNLNNTINSKDKNEIFLKKTFLNEANNKMKRVSNLKQRNAECNDFEGISSNLAKPTVKSTKTGFFSSSILSPFPVSNLASDFASKTVFRQTVKVEISTTYSPLEATRNQIFEEDTLNSKENKQLEVKKYTNVYNESKKTLRGSKRKPLLINNAPSYTSRRRYAKKHQSNLSSTSTPNFVNNQNLHHTHHRHHSIYLANEVLKNNKSRKTLAFNDIDIKNHEKILDNYLENPNEFSIIQKNKIKKPKSFLKFNRSKTDESKLSMNRQSKPNFFENDYNFNFKTKGQTLDNVLIFSRKQKSNQNLHKKHKKKTKNILLKTLNEDDYEDINQPKKGLNSHQAKKMFRHNRAKLSDSIRIQPNWWIPFSYLFGTTQSTTGRTMRQFWLQNETIRFVDVGLSSNQFLLANPHWIYPYKVNYDNKNWQLIIKQLHLNHAEIPTMSRMQLILDSETYLKHSVVPHFYVNLISYLKQESELGVLLTGLDSVHSFVDAFSGTQIIGSLIVHLLPVIQQFDRQLRITSASTNPELSALWLLRPLRLAKLYQLRCLANLGTCAETQQVSRWLLYPTALDAENHQQITAICYYLFTQSSTSEISLLKGLLRQKSTQWSVLIKLAGCVRDESLIQMAVEQILQTRNAAVYLTALKNGYSVQYNRKFRELFWLGVAQLSLHERQLLFAVNTGKSDVVAQHFIHSARTLDELSQIKALLPHWPDVHLIHIEYMQRKLHWMHSRATEQIHEFIVNPQQINELKE